MWARRDGMANDMVNVDLYSAIIAKVCNALNTLISGEKPGFLTLSKGLAVLLCAEVVQQRCNVTVYRVYKSPHRFAPSCLDGDDALSWSLWVM